MRHARFYRGKHPRRRGWSKDERKSYPTINNNNSLYTSVRYRNLLTTTPHRSERFVFLHVLWQIPSPGNLRQTRYYPFNCHCPRLNNAYVSKSAYTRLKRYQVINVFFTYNCRMMSDYYRRLNYSEESRVRIKNIQLRTLLNPISFIVN